LRTADPADRRPLTADSRPSTIDPPLTR